ncbi:MAG: PKD domain protein, partial [Candidatus Methanoperedens nitroreducens]
MVKGKYVLEIAIVLLIMSLIPAAIAAPDITSWGNNKTNNNTPTISISIGDTIRFNATANETLSPWEWYVDNVITKSATSGTSDIFDYTFNAIKTYTVKVNGSNGSNASDTISWTVTVQAAPPATSKPTITSWGNTKTNNSSLSIEINRTESVTFNATANQTINTWNWFLNGNNTLTNNSSFTYQFNNGGSHTVSVNGTNTTNGTTDNTTVWNIQVIDNEPPGNITLSTNTSGTTWINWIWTNPPDFNFAMVYIDEIWKRNVNTNTYNTSP